VLVLNDSPKNGALPPAYAGLLGRDAPALVLSYPSLSDDRSPTPLHDLQALAGALRIGRLYAKDEGFRPELRSFKALGGAFAVARLLQVWAQEELGRPVAPSELMTPEIRAIAAGKTVTCATAGNHGRSVAAGARLLGCRAVIFVHRHVAAERLEAMQAAGADIEVVQGSYDDSVAECTRVAAERGWQIVSDTTWPGYETIPGYVMQGYTVMVDEALSAIEAKGERLTHIFVQGGVGGFAAAVAGHAALRYGADRPKIVVVEPERANCLLQSAQAGAPIRIDEGEPTIMGMLACYQPSLVAWRILQATAHAFMDVPESGAVEVMRRLAAPRDGDPAIVAGESGGVGLAGLMQAAADPKTRSSLALTEASRVMVIISEGATAPRRYREIVGMSAEAVLARAPADIAG
jgi:diaminopropionate ammonia-lyase